MPRAQTPVKKQPVPAVWPWNACFGCQAKPASVRDIPPQPCTPPAKQPRRAVPPAVAPAIGPVPAQESNQHEDIVDIDVHFEPGHIPPHQLQRYLADEAALIAMHSDHALDAEADPSQVKELQHLAGPQHPGSDRAFQKALQAPLAPLLEGQASAKFPDQPRQPLQPLPGLHSTSRQPTAGDKTAGQPKAASQDPAFKPESVTGMRPGGLEVWESSSSGSTSELSGGSPPQPKAAKGKPPSSTAPAGAKEQKASRSCMRVLPGQALAGTLRRFSWGKKQAGADAKAAAPGAKAAPKAKPGKAGMQTISLEKASLHQALATDPRQAGAKPVPLDLSPSSLNRPLPRSLSLLDSPTNSSSDSSRILPGQDTTGLDGGASGSTSSSTASPDIAGPSSARVAAGTRSPQAYNIRGRGSVSRSGHSADELSTGSAHSHRSRHSTLTSYEPRRSRRSAAASPRSDRSSVYNSLSSPRPSHSLARSSSQRSSLERPSAVLDEVAAALPPDSPTTNPRRFFRLTDLQATDLWLAAIRPQSCGGNGACERLAGLGRAAMSYHVLKYLSDRYPHESRANLQTKAHRFLRREALSNLRLVWRFYDATGKDRGRGWSDKEQAVVVEALLGAADSFHEQRLTRGIVYNLISLLRAVEQVQLD